MACKMSSKYAQQELEGPTALTSLRIRSGRLLVVCHEFGFDRRFHRPLLYKIYNITSCIHVFCFNVG